MSALLAQTSLRIQLFPFGDLYYSLCYLSRGNAGCCNDQASSSGLKDMATNRDMKVFSSLPSESFTFLNPGLKDKQIVNSKYLTTQQIFY